MTVNVIFPSKKRAITFMTDVMALLCSHSIVQTLDTANAKFL